MIIQTFVFCLLTFAAFQLFRLYRYARKKNSIFGNMPGPTRHWLYGTMHLYPKESWKTIKYGLEITNKYKDFYIQWISFVAPIIVVCHPKTVKAVLRTSEPKPVGFFGVYRMGLPWLGEGLLIAKGERWARTRKLLTPAFHFEILRPYIDIYNDSANILIDNLGKFADSNKTFELFSYISKATLDVILRCAFSYHADVQNDKIATHPYVEAVEEISHAWQYRLRRLLLYPDWIFYLTPTGRKFKRQCDYVHRVAEDVISKRRKTLEEDGERKRKYLDFLDILLTAKDENGVGLTPLEIRNEVDTFLFEGHDTTSAGLSWILYNLATHPECQKKCQDEIDSILQGRETDDITWDDIPNMTYLTMCMKEGMRDGSPVPIIQREFTQEFEIAGHKIPAGSSVVINIYGLHHNEHVWDKPMEFIPERFSKENMAKMDPFQYVPFSAGPRNCIGQHFAQNEEKVILAKLLKRYWFEVDPTHGVKKKIAAVMRAEDGIMMYVKRR